MKKSDFNYTLPPHLIAQQPLPDRTASRLLTLHKQHGAVTDRYFTDFIDLINPNDILVFNDTKVIPARLYGHKATGGRIEMLIERIVDSNTAIAHIRASKAPKANAMITLDQGYQCRVLGRVDDLFSIQCVGDDSILTILDKIGHIPLPPYITRADDAADLMRYQTVFAQQAGAVAAPTAGLHFDESLMQAIAAKGVQQAFVTLHVGSGTFQPVRVENLADHLMHKEYFEVSDASINAIANAKANGGRVVAIGTTALRALESAAQLQTGSGDTDLFITPGYEFKVVDALLTNFHLPESTLLMLVAAFAGYDSVMQAYQHAIAHSYRFFSYGDAMFIAD